MLLKEIIRMERCFRNERKEVKSMANTNSNTTAQRPGPNSHADVSCQTLLSPPIEFSCCSDCWKLVNPGNEAIIVVIFVANTSVMTEGHIVNEVGLHFMNANENVPTTILRVKTSKLDLFGTDESSRHGDSRCNVQNMLLWEPNRRGRLCRCISPFRVVASVPFKRVALAALERTEFRMNKIVFRRQRCESLPGDVAFSIL
jgi:hypothetical protein